MKVLVFGAGVLGSYLAHVLCQAGNSVTMLARGERKLELEQQGLVIRHHLQHKTTVDQPAITDNAQGEHWDAVFAVMQYQQMQQAQTALAALDTPLLVLVGNNVAALAMQEAIISQSPTPKTVVFGFQPTGGRRENGRVMCVRVGEGHLTCGFADRPLDAATQATLQSLFQGVKYTALFQPNMDAWYKSHLALILPVSYLCYALACDLKRSTRAQRSQALDAVREGYRLLQAQGIPVLPEGSERSFDKGAQRAKIALLMGIMAKTSLGRLAASDHCRNAVIEMQQLDEAFAALRAKHADLPMPAWDALRSSMPDWATLRQMYVR